MEISEQPSPQKEATTTPVPTPEAVNTESEIATSSQIQVPEKLIDQVIGQEHAV